MSFFLIRGFSSVGLKRYIENSAWVIAEKILRLVAGLFVGVLVARHLGPENFGTLNYAQAIVALLLALTTLGLDEIVVKELVKNPSRSAVLIGTSWALKLCGSVLLILLLYLGFELKSNDDYVKIIVLIIASSTIFQSFNVIDFFFQSQVQSKYVAISNVVSLAISSLAKIILIIQNADLIAFAYVICFESVVLMLMLIIAYHAKSSSFKSWIIDWEVAKRLLADSWPLIISFVLISIYMKIDQVMIKEIVGLDAVGKYAAAVRLSEAWYFIPMVVASSVFPAIINAKKLDNLIYRFRLKKLYTLMIWMGITVAIPVSFLNNWIIGLLYGEAFKESAAVLSIHIWTGIFVFLGVASGKWLIAEGYQKISLLRSLCGMVLNIILNLFLIPFMGIIGAAYATLISQIFSTLLFDFFNYKTRETFFLKIQAINPF